MFSTLPQGLEFCLAVLSILFNIKMGINLAITFSGRVYKTESYHQRLWDYVLWQERKKKISFNHKNRSRKKEISQHMYPIKGSNSESSRIESWYIREFQWNILWLSKTTALSYQKKSELQKTRWSSSTQLQRNKNWTQKKVGLRKECKRKSKAWTVGRRKEQEYQCS